MATLRMVLPKGRIQAGVVRLFRDAGILIDIDDRIYTPRISDPELSAKLMKPQNIPQLVELGSHDVGFTGYDWVVETNADVVELMDLGLDPVRIVSAIPESMNPEELHTRRIVVATEYIEIARRYLDQKGYRYVLVRTYGATEVFPPDDADLIVDNTSTGRTLQEHHLKVLDVILTSSTRWIANRAALADPWKREKIEQLRLLFQAVLNARDRVMLEMNVPADKLEEVARILPCMRAPTISPLYGENAYAVKAAVPRTEVPRLIPLLKKLGATDILEYEFRKVIA